MIRGNRVFRTHRGLWLDWMAQGTRVTRNLFHDNLDEDLFVEVNHGPFLVDNNLFLSAVNLRDMSEGGAYAHNLFAGRITNRPEPDRETPYHPAHSTEVAGLARTTGGDNRFYNNLFVGDGTPPSAESRSNLQEVRWIDSHGLWGYDGREFPLQTGGNAYLNQAQPCAQESSPLLLIDHDPDLRFVDLNRRATLHFDFGQTLRQAQTTRVTTERLGNARIPNLPYVNADGSPLVVDTDYSGKRRSGARPTPGPFEKVGTGTRATRVW
jgi:hypothetical protein